MTADASTLAERFLAARERSLPLAPLSEDVSLDLEQAYDVQARFAELWCERKGDRIRGYKISLTSPEQQANLGTGEPCFGVLFEESLLRSPASVDLDQFNGLLVEAELAFLVDEDLPDTPTPEQFVEACRIAAAIELPSSRYRDWLPLKGLQLSDLIADNWAANRLVLGDAVPASEVDLAAVAMQAQIDCRPVLEGDSSAVLGSPLNSISWLARELASKGRQLGKGMVVTTGTFTAPLMAEPGELVVEFAGVGRATVTFHRGTLASVQVPG